MSQSYELPHYFEYESVAVKPTVRIWLRHLIFLAITFCTATMAGVLFPFGKGVLFPALDLPIWNDTLLLLSWAPSLYSLFVIDVVYQLLTNSAMLIEGLSFSVPLLIILISHEMGHYVACRLF